MLMCILIKRMISTFSERTYRSEKILNELKLEDHGLVLVLAKPNSKVFRRVGMFVDTVWSERLNPRIRTGINNYYRAKNFKRVFERLEENMIVFNKDLPETEVEII